MEGGDGLRVCLPIPSWREGPRFLGLGREAGIGYGGEVAVRGGEAMMVALCTEVELMRGVTENGGGEG